MAIERAAVIGAGVMGSGIAAQIANAGIPVLLLDVVPEGAADRNALAKGALERMQKADPAPFMSRQAARLVTPGNLEDDLDAARRGRLDRRGRGREPRDQAGALRPARGACASAARSCRPTPRPCRSRG